MSDPIRLKEIETACPICGKPAEEKYYPFCSKRCADIDLYRWLSGNYVIPENESDDDDEKIPDDENDM